MTFNRYQKAAFTTAIYPRKGRGELHYPVMKLCGESGELANKVGKLFRKHGDYFVLDGETRDAIRSELGDILWYVAAIATELHLKLDDVAKRNIEKLAARKAEGTLGDDRERSEHPINHPSERSEPL